MNEQILIGLGCVLLCGFGLWHSATLLRRSHNGRRLGDLFGAERALWILRGLLTAGTIFGVLLAADVVRPIEW